MKTLYLKASTKEAIIADIQKVAPYSKNMIGDMGIEIGYNGQIEYSDKNICVHYIGDLLIDGQLVGAEHCNVLVSDDFTHVFDTEIICNNPKHVFGI
jgi:hypothetical protein